MAAAISAEAPLLPPCGFITSLIRRSSAQAAASLITL